MTGWKSALMIAAGFFLAMNQETAAQSLTSRVLVIYNSNPAILAASVNVADYYVSKRGIPAANRCGVSFPNQEQITEAEWQTVRGAIRTCLDGVGRSNVLYVVLSYGTPYLLVRGGTNIMALDSYVADIWDANSTQNFPTVPNGAHRYYMDAQSGGNLYGPFQSFEAFRLQPRSTLIYAVWRLDGASEALVKAMIDNAVNIEAAGGLGANGKTYIDRRNPDSFLNLLGTDYSYLEGDHDLRQAGRMARTAGLTVEEEQESPEIGTPGATIATAPDAALFCGWYGLGTYNDVFTWRPGAVGWHLDSGSAVNPRAGGNWAAQAIQRGITITTGAVTEPYLNGLVHPDIAFRHLLQGGTVGDAFLRATPWLKWRILNLGDPLYRPFPGGRAPFTSPLVEDSVSFNPRYLLGGKTTQATITTKDPAPSGGRVIALEHVWAPYVYGVPATVTIPQGERRIVVPVNTRVMDDASYINVGLRASYGATSTTATALVFPLLSLVDAVPTRFKGGTSANGYVQLNDLAPAGGTIVSLSSNNTSLLQVPPAVTVNFGTVIQTFTITTSPVATETVVKITATGSGGRSVDVNISLFP